MNWERIFTFIMWFILCCIACCFIGLVFIGIAIGILLLFRFNIYVATGIIIGIIALYMTISIMKED